MVEGGSACLPEEAGFHGLLMGGMEGGGLGLGSSRSDEWVEQSDDPEKRRVRSQERTRERKAEAWRAAPQPSHWLQ